MANNYDKYIKRLRAKRTENPEYAFYRQTMQTMTEPLKQINSTMQGQMNLAGGSSGARSQAGLNSQNALQGMAANLYQDADRNGIARNDQIDNQIMQLESQRDQERNAGKDAGLKSAIQIGGTVLGAAAGSIVPGVGTMLGAQVGAGLGGVASSFVGGGGEYGMNYVNPDQLMQGIGDTLAGISSVSTLAEHKKFISEFGQLYPNMKDATSEELAMIRTFLMMGDYKGAIAAMRGYAPQTTPTTETGSPDWIKYDTGTPQITPTTETVNAPEITPVDTGKTITLDKGTQTTQGTGKTYKEWQANVNGGDMSSDTIKMRNIESYKERGYWLDANGNKKTTAPTGYDKYYGAN